MDMPWKRLADKRPPDGAKCWIVVVHEDQSREVDIATYRAASHWWVQRDDDVPGSAVSHWAPYAEPALPPEEDILVDASMPCTGPYLGPDCAGSPLPRKGPYIGPD